MKTISVPPNPSKLIENLTRIGYSFKTAVADLVDNSIQANASTIYLDILSEDESEEPCIIICDNGEGMGHAQLKNAMTFGTEKDYGTKDLGKFGLGLKTASLSQCRVLTVFSKPRSSSTTKSKLNVMEWDMPHVYASEKWEVLNPTYKDLSDWKQKIHQKYKQKIEDGGTLIIWSDMKEFSPDLYSDDRQKLDKFMADLIGDLELHLGLTFHRFIDNSIDHKKKIKIFFDEKKIESIDPFCSEEKIRQLDKKTVHMISGKDDQKKNKVVFSPYILPKENQFSSREAYKKASQWGTWLNCQGFYFYRNGRLLKNGDWSSCATKDRKNILLRVAVDFNEKMDLDFQINISKEKANIPKRYKKEVKDFLSEWIEESRKKWYGKEGSLSKLQTKQPPKKYKSLNIDNIVEFKIIKDGDKILSNRKAKDKKIIISVPASNPFSKLLEKEVGKPNKFKELSTILLGILYIVKSNRLKKEHIPSLVGIQKHILEDK